MGKKITQLATITEVADDDLIVGVDVSDTSGSDNGTNKKFTKATLLNGLAPLNPQLTGWNPDGETWVYHNVDDPTGYIKIEDKDVSANYSPGMRIMFTNGGNVIKGILTAVAFSSPNTILTFLHEIDPADNQALYLLQNSAITENYYSTHKAPLGFPMSPAKWSVVLTDTTQRSQASPTGATWYNLGSLSVSVPIGVWRLSTKYMCITALDSTPIGAEVAISTSNSSVSNNDLYMRSVGYARAFHPNIFSEFVNVVSKTTFYLIERTTTNSTTNIVLYNDLIPLLIRFTCAYL